MTEAPSSLWMMKGNLQQQELVRRQIEAADKVETPPPTVAQ